MASISNERIRELLEGPHQAVLSVGRDEKGPVAVPMSYTYNGDRFFFVTSPTSLHGRLMSKAGRATLTIQFEEVGTDSVHQWYVMAEGRVVFTDADPAPHVRAMLTKDRGSQNWDRWVFRYGTWAHDAGLVEDAKCGRGVDFTSNAADLMRAALPKGLQD